MRCLGTLFTQTQARGTTSFALFEVRMLATVQNSFSRSCFQILLSKYLNLSMLVDFWLICFIIKQEDLEYQKRSAPVQSSLTFPRNSHVRDLWDLWCPAASSKDTCARRAAGWSWCRWSKWRKTTWGHHPWRIHHAGIYANIKGVYWWDPCYHITIYSIDGSYYTYGSRFTLWLCQNSSWKWPFIVSFSY